MSQICIGLQTRQSKQSQTEELSPGLDLQQQGHPPPPLLHPSPGCDRSLQLCLAPEDPAEGWLEEGLSQEQFCDENFESCAISFAIPIQ